MSFVNQNSVLIYDKLKNLYNFRWEEGKVICIYFDKDLKKYNRYTLVEDATSRFDAVIDEKGKKYVIYQNKDGDIILMTYDRAWNRSRLGGKKHVKVFNLNIFIHDHKLHIVYCIPSKESDKIYGIYHHYYEGQKWKTFLVQDINRKNLLNPLKVIKNKKELLMCYYNFTKEGEEIYVKKFDIEDRTWKKATKLTLGKKDKLYLDGFMTDFETLHITYSEYIQGNLAIKYEKYKIQNNKMNKIEETMISNPSNCSYPTFVKTNDKFWIVWTEYDQVVSSFTTDDGLTWNGPYLWKESKNIDFLRYKFSTINKDIEKLYQLSHVFGKDYPEFSFIGFGSLQKTEKMALKEMKKKEEESIVESIEIQENNEIERINDDEIEDTKDGEGEIDELKNKIENLEGKLESIEEYLKRRRRGILFPNKK